MSDFNLDSFGGDINAVVIGASGGVGSAFCELLAGHDAVKAIVALSRSGTSFSHDKIIEGKIDTDDQESVESAAAFTKEHITPNLIIIATGLLHNNTIQPEKSMRDINFDTITQVLQQNTVGQAVVMRYFVPLLPREGKSVCAVMTAKVGSISANDMGGWYAYRMAKCATNMLIKNVAIETGRKYKHASIIGLHPETVDTQLSKPFQSFVDPSHVRAPDNAIAKLINVINNRGSEDSGHIFDLHDEVIKP